MDPRILPLCRNWLFSANVAPRSTERDFDDAHFDRVTVPHSNKLFPWHSFDDREFQFVSVYRRHFTPPSTVTGRRVFVDFAGVMTAATVYLNGQKLGEHRGGFVPFSFELTSALIPGEDNVLAVVVDSTERKDIPPFGDRVDYLTFGGIYREVNLRVVGQQFIENLFAKPVDVLSHSRRLQVRCFLQAGASSGPDTHLEVELRDGETRIAQTRTVVTTGSGAWQQDVTFQDLPSIELWDLDRPKLYTVIARWVHGSETLDSVSTRIGFREARFTPRGFSLNGRIVKLRGLNRHQLFPYVGHAMPARGQERDAEILKRELKVNIVRTSHYPQSTAFLDRCDELGLLVFEEIPGWQHIGNDEWKDLAARDVEAMIRRDWNHPSICVWGVRVNESDDVIPFNQRCNELAHSLDDSRQTTGVRHQFESKLVEDVFAMNDFNATYLRPPDHPLYFVSEFSGHMYPTKRFDNVERVQEHALRHARIHQLLGADERFAGGLGWCAFDYNTHAEFGSGDRVCYHGVSDMFRIPKPAAQLYRSQCSPAEEVVIEPCFHWAIGDHSDYGGPGVGLICSNCDVLKVSIGGELKAELHPDRERFGNLPHPPFFFNSVSGVAPWRQKFADLRIDGYVGGKLVGSRTFSSKALDQAFSLEVDDAKLRGDGIDMTRVVFRVTDEFGGARPFATGAITLEIAGPGELIGENPFALNGGVGAVWLKAKEGAGSVRLRARHPQLGERTVSIDVSAAAPEPW